MCKFLESAAGRAAGDSAAAAAPVRDRRDARRYMNDYFEYNSTIRLSLMSLGRSERSGSAFSEPVNFFASISTQPGARSISCERVSASWMRSWLRDFSTIETWSPGLTAYEGRLTFLPL